MCLYREVVPHDIGGQPNSISGVPSLSIHFVDQVIEYALKFEGLEAERFYGQLV